MPNRILHERICTSATVAELSADEERFFYRLLVQCDDYGRFDARPAVLRARCFPLALDTIDNDTISIWMQRLESVGLLTTYEVEGATFIQITTWDRHQQTRAKRSKYPPPPAPASNGNHLIADDGNSPRIRYSRSDTRESESGGDARARAELPAANAAPPEIPVQEHSEPPETKPEPVLIGVPNPGPVQNKYGQFLKRVGENAKQLGREILIRGPSARNGAAVKESPYSVEQLAAALVAYESGDWTNEHIAKCGHPVWAVVEGSGLWLERDRLGVNGHAKAGRSASGPDRTGRGVITADPRAFSGIDRG